MAAADSALHPVLQGGSEKSVPGAPLVRGCCLLLRAYDPVGQERVDLESKEGLRTKETKMRDES